MRILIIPINSRGHRMRLHPELKKHRRKPRNGRQNHAARNLTGRVAASKSGNSLAKSC